MYLLSVMPISTSAHTDVLDYFSKDFVAPGMIVHVAVRKKTMKALVLSATPIADAKHTIKTSTFALRKIIDVVGSSPISERSMRSMEHAARYLSVPIGVVIANTTPTWLFDMETTVLPKSDISVQQSAVRILQASIKDRADWYQQQVIDGKRLLIISPTEDHTQLLQNNFNTKAMVMPPKPSTKKFSTIAKQLEETRSNIIVVSPIGLGLIDMLAPDMIVFEHEQDNRYIRQKLPHIDMRMVGEVIAGAHGVDVVYADRLTRAYTHARAERNEATYIDTPVWPQLSHTTIVGYKKDENKPKDQQHNFFSPELLSELEKSSIQRTLVYVPRKGLAPVVICSDCGTAVLCEQCGLPCKLVEKKSGGNTTRWFACKYPDHLIPAHDHCAQCGGHRLEGIGVSTLRIRDELQTLFPEKTISVFDQDTAATKTQQKNIIDAWHTDSNTILVATSLVFPFLDNQVESTIIPSVDMLLAHTSPEAQESIMHTLSLIEEKTQHSILVQTRLPDSPIFSAINNHNLQSWFKTEQDLRKQYGFPPYGIWLSIHARLTEKTVAAFQATASGLPFKPSSLHIARGRKTNELYGKAMFKIAGDSWNSSSQDPKLALLLRALPPGYWVEVATDSR